MPAIVVDSLCVSYPKSGLMMDLGKVMPDGMFHLICWTKAAERSGCRQQGKHF